MACYRSHFCCTLFSIRSFRHRIWRRLLWNVTNVCICFLCLPLPNSLFHSLHSSLSTLVLISLLLHLTGDWTPPGVQSKFHTWSGLGNQLENPSSIFTSRLHSISSSSSYSCPPLAGNAWFLLCFLFFFPLLCIILCSPSFLSVHDCVWRLDPLTRPVNIFLCLCYIYVPPSVYCQLSHSHISLCHKVHTQTEINSNNLGLFIIFCCCYLKPFCIFSFISFCGFEAVSCTCL